MKKFRFQIQDCAKAAIVMLVFSAALSRAMFNIALFLLVISCISSSDIRQRFVLAFQHTITKVSFALFLFILIGSFYSPAPPELIFRQIRTYALFFLIPVFIATIHEKIWQKRALWGFISSIVLILLLTYTDIWIEVPGSSSRGLGLGKDHSIFSDHVVQSILSVFFIALCSYMSQNSGQRGEKIIWTTGAVLSVFAITFLLSSRTGFILLGCVSVMFIYQRFKGKYFLLYGGCFTLLFVCFIMISPLALSRVNMGIFELKNISEFNNQSSFSLRFATSMAAWDMFTQQPIFGRGTGSYAYLAANYFKDCTWLCVHPHNQYLFFMAENGLVGLLIYFSVLISIIKMTTKVKCNLRHLVHCFSLILIVNSFINAPFWFNREAYFFYTMTALLATMMISSSESSDEA
jgi:O-antigen ligase